MAKLLTPYYQAADADGLPLSGATLTFYQAGTTTLVTIYQDAAGSTPRANPITASAAGVFPPVFLAPGNYKTVLKTAAGVTIQTVDGITVDPINGISDGDKNDVVVSGDGTVWTLKPVPNAKIATDAIDADKIARSARLAIAAKLGLEPRQPNLVDKLLSSAAVRGMYIRPISTNFIAIGIGLADDYKSVVEYRFLKNTDNMWLLRGGYAGREDATLQCIQPTLTGTYVTSGAPSTYTTTVGDTWTSGSFTHAGDVYFDSTVDNRGGVWEMSIGGFVRRISTYSATTILGRRQLIATNLPLGTYTLNAKFLGADPENAPTGGTARGWITYQAGSTTNKAVHLGAVKPPSSAADALLTQNSIPDFAIRARPAAASYNTEWVPQHSSVSGVSSTVSFKLIVDGITMSDVAGSQGNLTTYMECKTVEFSHFFNATNPNGASGNMWEHVISHTIRRDDPRWRLRNRLKVLQDTYVSKGYLAMLPCDSSVVSRLVLNNGTEITPVPADGSNSTFGFDVSGCMWAGEYSGTAGNYHGLAIHVSSLREACSLGGRTQPTTPGALEFRSDGVAKAYWTFADNITLLTGEIFTCEVQLAAITGVRFPNTLIRSI